MTTYIDFIADGKDGEIDFEKLLDAKIGIKRTKNKKYKFESKLNKNCNIDDLEIYISPIHVGKQQWTADWIKELNNTSDIVFGVTARKKNKNKKKSAEALEELKKIKNDIGLELISFLEEYNTSYDETTHKKVHYKYTKTEINNLLNKAFGKKIGYIEIGVPINKTKNYIKPDNFIVKEKYQNKCIGNAILEKVIKIADKNCLDIYIEANPNVDKTKYPEKWEKLKNLYSKYGKSIKQPKIFKNKSYANSEWFIRKNICKN